MNRLCERPGCANPAAVAYGMESDRLLVWLAVMPDPAAQRRINVVCRQHADAMVVPRGWTLDDRRESRPRLFRVPDSAVSRKPGRRTAQPRPDRLDGDPQLSFDADVSETRIIPPDPPGDNIVEGELTVGDIRPLGDVDPDETQAMKWRPVFDEADDLGGVLKASGPLLSRAFRGQSRNTDRKT